MEPKRDRDTNNNMAEKIINQLSTIIKDMNTIDDFSIILSTTNAIDKNTSPVHYVDSDRCLGLESWCVKQIFTYCQAQIFRFRRDKACRLSSDDVYKLNVYLNIALLLQAEINTFWNYKRELTIFLDVQEELRFAKLVLSHSPKSLQAFSYRIWLIKTGTNCNYEGLLKEELLVIGKAVHQSANNYHAWNHRIWCIEYLWTKSSNFDLILQEYEYSSNFINLHVSEHSGFHYRQYILQKFKTFNWSNIKDCDLIDFQRRITSMLGIFGKTVNPCIGYLSVLLYELFELCKHLNLLYPGHEAIWYHRRFVFKEIVIESKNVISKNNVYDNVLSYETQFVLSHLNSNNSMDFQYVQKYQKWLNNILGINLSKHVVLDGGDGLFTGGTNI